MICQHGYRDHQCEPADIQAFFCQACQRRLVHPAHPDKLIFITNRDRKDISFLIFTLVDGKIDLGAHIIQRSIACYADSQVLDACQRVIDGEGY